MSIDKLQEAADNFAVRTRAAISMAVAAGSDPVTARHGEVGDAYETMSAAADEIANNAKLVAEKHGIPESMTPYLLKDALRQVED